MKVLFITPSVSRAAGGIFEIERRIAQELCRFPGTSVQVYGVQDPFTEVDRPLWQEVPVETHPYFGISALRWSPGLMRSVLDANADVAHLHAMWMHTSSVVHKWSRRRKKPYVTTINGMLDPWALRNSRWKKRLASIAYESASLADAACLQVNSTAEYRIVRKFGLRNPISIIPNGVDLPSRSPVQLVDKERYRLLYLGRLHPKKGLDNLILAWAAFLKDGTPNPIALPWELVIAGWDQLDHERHLRKMVDELELSDSVSFVGPKFGDLKEELLFSADAFVLPSLSEGLPMGILEAFAHSLPVLMTSACNIPEGFAEGAAIKIESNVASIKTALLKLSRLSDTQRWAMGTAGFNLARTKFSWESAAAMLRDTYEWVANSGSVPDFVER